MRPAEILTRLGFILLSGCSFHASCNAGNELNMDKARAFVSEQVENYTGMKPTKVGCPDEVKGEKDGKIVCTFEVDGVPGTVTMTQTDAKGAIVISSMTGIVASAKLEAALQAQLQPPDPSLKVDCGARVHPSSPGRVLTCEVRHADSVVAHASVTIKDAENNVDFKIVSDDEPSAPAAEKAP